MTESKNVLTALRFDTVDGLYLQENDVEHEEYVLIEDLTDWLNENTRDLTEADIDDMAMTGGHARRNYSIYEKFVDVTALRGELTQSIAQLEEPERESVFRDSTNQITKLKSEMSNGKSRFGDNGVSVEVSLSDLNKLLAMTYHYEAETARLKGKAFTNK